MYYSPELTEFESRSYDGLLTLSTSKFNLRFVPASTKSALIWPKRMQRAEHRREPVEQYPSAIHSNPRLCSTYAKLLPYTMGGILANTVIDRLLLIDHILRAKRSFVC